MKPNKIFNLIAFILILCYSCRKNELELNKGHAPLEVTVSDESIVLDKNNPQSTALSVDWTTGSNQGTNAAIEYTLQIDRKGNNFSDGISLDMGRNSYQKTYKNEELNDLLMSEFGVAANTEIILECRVIAKVAAEVPDEVSPVQTISITTHLPITKTLYLLGDATPKGWDANNATEMTAVTNTPKAFSWTGRLNAGKFKFITTLGEFAPSYNKGQSNSSLYYRSSFDDPYDEQFEITEGGNYKIAVNLITMAIAIERTAGPEYERLWFVGDPTGWTFKEMTVNPLDPFKFHYNDNLSAGGEIKIGTVQGDFDAVFFRPTVNNTAEGSNLDVDKWAGNPDFKWNITGGTYKITLDIREMKIDILPFTPYSAVYMVGDATSIGWDVANAIPMQVNSGNPNEFTWTGTLKPGELKFSMDKQSDWNGAWFTASQANMAPSGTPQQMIYSERGSGLDYKWRIAENGTYSITLDQLKETVTITKQ